MACLPWRCCRVQSALWSRPRMLPRMQPPPGEPALRAPFSSPATKANPPFTTAFSCCLFAAACQVVVASLRMQAHAGSCMRMRRLRAGPPPRRCTAWQRS
jgi:hypothetical protein